MLHGRNVILKGVVLRGIVEKVLYNNINSRPPACIDQFFGLKKPLIKFVWPYGAPVVPVSMVVAFHRLGDGESNMRHELRNSDYPNLCPRGVWLE